MSVDSRFSRENQKELNEKHTKILKALMSRPENKKCADCRKKGKRNSLTRDPRWAAWNLGLFVCIQCSGVHRSMGTHISKVKSADLDSWTPEQIEVSGFIN
jgi:stromal membrane-associated protein